MDIFSSYKGMVDTEGYNKINNAAIMTRNAVRAGQWTLATSLWGQTENIISRVTSGIDFYNILTKMPYYSLRRQGEIPGNNSRGNMWLDK